MPARLSDLSKLLRLLVLLVLLLAVLFTLMASYCVACDTNGKDLALVESGATYGGDSGSAAENTKNTGGPLHRRHVPQLLHIDRSAVKGIRMSRRSVVDACVYFRAVFSF